MRFSRRGLKNCCLVGGFTIAAFARGNYLLGQVAGIAYALVAFGISIFITSELSQRATAPGHRTFCITATVLVSLALSFPAFISSDIQISLEQHAVDRAARTELNLLFASDPRFADLHVSTNQLKVINVTISGSVENSEAFDLLHSRLLDRAEHFSDCILHWSILDRSSSASIDGRLYFGTPPSEPSPTNSVLFTR